MRTAILRCRRILFLAILGVLLVSCASEPANSGVSPIGEKPTDDAAEPAQPSSLATDTTPATAVPSVAPTDAPTAVESDAAADADAAVDSVDDTATDDEAANEFPVVADIVANLAGLPLDAFFEESYKQMLLRDPELITEVGLAEIYGGGNDRLTDISDQYIRETQALESAMLEMLRAYDRETLSPEEQLSYDIYESYLDDLVRGHPYMYHNYPVTFFITSVPIALTQFFTDLHPVTSRQDAEDYITRLSQVDDKFEQLLEGLRIREQLGVIPPRFVFQWTLPGIRQTAGSAARNTPFYTAFAEKVREVNELSDDEQETLLAAAEAEIDASVIPAFQALESYMRELQSKATDDDGVWKLPDGEAYYNYTLRHHTTTEMTAGEIHELGKEELLRIQAEMRVLFDSLGYPQDAGLPELYERVARDGGTLYGEEIVAGYEALIVDAQERVGEAFDVVPQAEVIVVGVPQGGYYIPPAVDGSRPGAFYATDAGSETKFSMPTLAYHEAVPGHHFQLAIMQELRGLPSFRNGASFTANVEGWALYAEQLTAELGFYEDDPYGDLGRLQFEAFRAARLVVDTGIHAQGWTFDEAVNYMVKNTGLSRGMVEGQIARYVVWPGQSTSYKIGMIQFLALRQRAMEALGDAFDLKEFHNVVLTNGSMPLDILEQVVDDYVAEKLND